MDRSITATDVDVFLQGSDVMSSSDNELLVRHLLKSCNGFHDEDNR